MANQPDEQEPQSHTVHIVLSAPDEHSRTKLVDELKAHLNAVRSSRAVEHNRPIRLLNVEKPVALGSFEPVFLISMAVSVILSGSGIGLWCLKYRDRGGGQIPMASAEAADVIKALTQAAPAPRGSAEGDTAS